jgi:hypothetical protein
VGRLVDRLQLGHLFFCQVDDFEVRSRTITLSTKTGPDGDNDKLTNDTLTRHGLGYDLWTDAWISKLTY